MPACCHRKTEVASHEPHRRSTLCVAAHRVAASPRPRPAAPRRDGWRLWIQWPTPANRQPDDGGRGNRTGRAPDRGSRHSRAETRAEPYARCRYGRGSWRFSYEPNPPGQQLLHRASLSMRVLASFASSAAISASMSERMVAMAVRSSTAGTLSLSRPSALREMRLWVVPPLRSLTLPARAATRSLSAALMLTIQQPRALVSPWVWLCLPRLIRQALQPSYRANVCPDQDRDSAHIRIACKACRVSRVSFPSVSSNPVFVQVNSVASWILPSRFSSSYTILGCEST